MDTFSTRIYTMDTFSTTRPVVAGNLPTQPFFTKHLVIRLFRDTAQDIEAYHNFRTQPEINDGKNFSLEDSENDLLYHEIQKLIPDENDYRISLGIFLKKADDNEGDLIGYGGVNLSHGPEVQDITELSWQFKKGYLEIVYQMEFVEAFLQFWSSLPRQDTITTENPFDDCTCIIAAPELLYVHARPDDDARNRVLHEVGFFGCPDHVCSQDGTVLNRWILGSDLQKWLWFSCTCN